MCKGKGFVVVQDGYGWVVQRCDECNAFGSDAEAGEDKEAQDERRRAEEESRNRYGP